MKLLRNPATYFVPLLLGVVASAVSLPTFIIVLLVLALLVLLIVNAGHVDQLHAARRRAATYREFHEATEEHLAQVNDIATKLDALVSELQSENRGLAVALASCRCRAQAAHAELAVRRAQRILEEVQS